MSLSTFYNDVGKLGGPSPAVTEVKSAISKFVHDFQREVVLKMESAADYESRKEKWFEEFEKKTVEFEKIERDLKEKLETKNAINSGLTPEEVENLILKSDKMKALVDMVEKMEAERKQVGYVSGISPKEQQEIRQKQDFCDWFYATGKHEQNSGRRFETRVTMKRNYTKSEENNGLITKADNSNGIMSTDRDPYGGYIARLEYISNQITRILVEKTPFENFANSIVIDGKRFMEPFQSKLPTGPQDASERQVVTNLNDTGELQMLEISCEQDRNAVRISREMINGKTIVDPESYIQDLLREQVELKRGLEFLQGDGLHGPAGILQPIGRGAEINVLSSGVADDLPASFTKFFDFIPLVHSSFIPNSRFFGTIRTLVEIWKYVDETGRFRVPEDNAFQIRGFPYEIFPDMPEIAANSKSLLFGDLNAAYLVVYNNWVDIIRDDITGGLAYILYLFGYYRGGAVRQPQAVAIMQNKV